MKRNRNLLFLLPLILIISACYHSTGIEAPVSVVSRTDENNAKLYISKSPKTMGAYDDFYLSNNKFDVIVDGGILGERKQNFLAPTGGTIIDITNIQVDALGNKESYNNDNINQIFQVVNNDLSLPVAYISIKVDSIGDDSASLVCEGYVMDKKGKLKSQGFAVDPDTKLVKDLKVTTVYYLERNSEYLKMTTVLENVGDKVAHIFTIGDYYFLGGNVFRKFVPAPGYGYAPEDPSSGLVYASFVAFDQHEFPYQSILEFSPDDGVVMCQFDSSNQAYNKSGSMFTIVSKVGKASDVLNKGESITFERYLIPALSPNLYTSYFNSLSLFDDLVLNPRVVIRDVGTLNGSIRSGWKRTNYIIQFEQLYPAKYFNGEEMVTSPVPIPLISYRTGDQASFSIWLPEGIYQVRVSGHGIKDYVVNTYEETVSTEGDEEEVTEERQIDVKKQGRTEMGMIPLESDMYGELRVIIKDNSNNLIPGRISFFDTNFNSDCIDFGDNESVEMGSKNYFFLYYGDMKIKLKLGSYKTIVSAGPLYSLDIKDLSVSTATDDNGNTVIEVSPDELSIQLQKVVEQGNYMSFDPAVLSHYSYNCSVSAINRAIESLSEHVDGIMFADVNTIAQLIKYNEALEARYRKNYMEKITIPAESLRIFYGAKVKSFCPEKDFPEGFGEYLVFPVKRVDGLKGYGIGETGDRNFATIYDNLKKNMEMDNLYVGLINPRDGHKLLNGVVSGLFEALHLPVPADLSHPYFSRVSEHGTGTTNNVFTLIELLENVKYADYLKNRADWFNILNKGYKKLAFGASDWEGATPYFTGNPRTYVYYEHGDNDFNEDDFLAQFASGHSFVSTGPFLDVKVNSSIPGDTVSVSSNNVDVSINIQAPDWIPVDEVRIIVNGEVVYKESVPQTDNVNRYSKTVNVALPSEDSFLVVECGATLENIAAGIFPQGVFAKVYPGVQPLAFTNPIFVDRDGDGKWHGK